MCLEYYHKDNDKKRENNTNPYLGPSYSKDELLNAFTKFDNDIYVELKLHEQIRDIIAQEITDGSIVGWFEGRLEFGGKVGNRSILANPRDPQMKRRLNRVIKKEKGSGLLLQSYKKNIRDKNF